MSDGQRNALQLIQSASREAQDHFVARRSLISFEEYLDIFLAHPRRHSRNIAQYIRDMFDFYGTEDIETPRGPQRRFSLFDQAFRNGRDRLVGHEGAQNEVYRLLNNFIRERRLTRLILLHGPNGSAKTSFVNCVLNALEHYSQQDDGALYRFNWVFPTEKISRAAIGFGDDEPTSNLASYARLNDLEIDAKLLEELRDPPILLIPKAQRQEMLVNLFGPQTESDDENSTTSFILSDYIFHGDLSAKSRRIFDALLTSYRGDLQEVFKHVQVERFYISRRYRTSAVTIEPQLRVDAASRQVTADRSLSALPTSLQNQSLFEPFGPLVDGNRGVVAFNDFLKRPQELNRYLLNTSEDGIVALDHAILFIDVLLIGTANEDYLEAFKGSPDYISFQGRLAQVRMPYMLDYTVERDIYDQLLSQADIDRPVSPHTTEMAALWAVLTRLVKPNPENFDESIREVMGRLTPIEKADIYAHGRLPDGLSHEQARELRAAFNQIGAEGIHRNPYEGRFGISPRGMRRVLLTASQRPGAACLNTLSLVEELRGLVRDPSVYPFLRLKPDGDYHQPDTYLDVLLARFLDIVDVEVRRSMGLIDEAQYADYFSRYVNTISHWLKKEKMYNKVTQKYEAPSETFMAEVEKTLGISSKPSDFRNSIITKVGAFRIDNPDAEISFEEIFPDLFSSLHESFYSERRRVIQRIGQNVLAYLQDDTDGLTPSDIQQAETTLDNMKTLFGYDRVCAREAIAFLITERYH